MTEQTKTSDVAAAPLTSWKKEPTLANLKQDLLDAKSIHDTQVMKIKEWLDNLNITGKAKIKVAPGNSSIVPKLIRKQAEWRYPALSEPFLSTDQIFGVKPVTWEDRKAAQQNQLLLNHQVSVVLDRTKFIDEYVRTAVDEGTVIIRTGWRFEEEEVELEVPDVRFYEDASFAPTLQEVEAMRLESPSQFATDVPDELKEALELSRERGVAIRPEVVGMKKVKKMKTVRNHPTAEICNNLNVIIDPSCEGDLSKAGFVIHSFESSKSLLKKDKKYKNLEKIMPEANSPLATPDHSGALEGASFQFSDEPRKKLIVYEYWGFWDIHGDGTTVPIVAAWVGNTLIRLEENPYPDKELPFIVVHYLPKRKATHGEPDGELLVDNQRIIGAVTRGMIDIMGKSANGQTGMRKDMLDATNKRRYERGLDYEFNANVDPRVGVHMHTFPEIPSSAPLMVMSQNQEAESLTGVKTFAEGVSGNSLGDVAAGVRGALDASSKRELGILRRLSAGIVEMGRKFISMNAEFLSEEEVVRVTNEEFVTVRRDDLAGKFDLKLQITTAEEDEKKASELAFMLQTMGNNMDPEMSKMILSDIARLRKMPDLAKKIESYQPQPDPLQVRKQELEVALLEAQIEKERALAAQAGSTAQLNVAKSDTEVVKQGNLQSDTDKKNLDFVEQESGVTQERNLQMAGEQARSQAQLKGIDREIQREKNEFDLVKEYVKKKTPELAI